VRSLVRRGRLCGVTPVCGFCAVLLAALLAGCSGVSSSAVPLQGPAQPAYHGAMAVYATRVPTVGRELGVVEARGVQGDTSIEALFPELVRRAQELGGNALVLDQAGARFELVTTWTNYQQMMPCGSRGLCMSWQPVPTTYEDMSVVLRGRAWLLPEGAP